MHGMHLPLQYGWGGAGVKIFGKCLVGGWGSEIFILIGGCIVWRVTEF